MIITTLSKTSESFETRVKKWECLSPAGLFALEITGIQRDDKGKEISESTYQFFMTQEQLKELSEVLIK